MTLQKENHNYCHVVVFGQRRNLSSHSYYDGNSYDSRLGCMFSMFESRLSWDCRIFKHSRWKNSLETSGYCRREAYLRALESLLCRALLSFDNSRLTDSALVFLVFCKLGSESHPLFFNLVRHHLIRRYYCLLFWDKSALFLNQKPWRGLLLAFR